MKDKRILICLLMISTFFISMMALLATADTTVSTNARSSALYNPDTDIFLHSKNAKLKLPMASTTKIITALIAIEELDLNEEICISRDAVGVEGSSVYLKENDILTARDLIYSVLLQSANDAATALAIHISGSIPAFAEKMTSRATQIGATDTSFQNPHGLDSNDHYTTAYDLALITAEALKNETFKQICSTYRYTFKLGDATRTVVNHNKLLKKYDGCIGVKTGYTQKSGRCLVSAAERNGVTLVAVTLNDPDDWMDHTNMLNHGFDELEQVNLLNIITIPESIATLSTDGATVPIGLASDSIVKRLDENIEYYIDLPSYIAYDVRKDDRLGEVKLTVGNRTKTINIIALSDVKIKKATRRFL